MQMLKMSSKLTFGSKMSMIGPSKSKGVGWEGRGADDGEHGADDGEHGMDRRRTGERWRMEVGERTGGWADGGGQGRTGGRKADGRQMGGWVEWRMDGRAEWRTSGWGRTVSDRLPKG